ncbi:hypothetical protein rerp_36830 [Rhodococcus erythropolis]|nr:hypothetical protein rerp_36830 [Rhodococcus erythropolis]
MNSAALTTSVSFMISPPEKSSGVDALNVARGSDRWWPGTHGIDRPSRRSRIGNNKYEGFLRFLKIPVTVPGRAFATYSRVTFSKSREEDHGLESPDFQGADKREEILMILCKPCLARTP